MAFFKYFSVTIIIIMLKDAKNRIGKAYVFFFTAEKSWEE